MSAHSFGHSTRTDPLQVLEDMKRLAVEQLGSLPGGLFRPIEQALQSPLPGVESFHDQAALLVLRQHSASHVMRFRQQIGQGFDEFSGVHGNGGIVELGLIDERLMDFHLAGQRLGEVLDQRYKPLLEEMTGRLATLSTALDVEPGRNPLAPSRLATAFIEAIGDADLPEALGGLLFQQYQHELVRVLDELYARINALLAEAGYGSGHRSGGDAVRARPAPVARAPQRGDDQVESRFPQDIAAASDYRGGAAGADEGSGAAGFAGGVGSGYGAAPAAGFAPARPQSQSPAAGGPSSREDSPLHDAGAAPDLTAALQRTSDELAGLRVQLHAWRNDSLHGDVLPERGLPQRRSPQRRDLRVAEVVSIASLLQAESPDVYARALATSGRLSDAIRGHLTEGARRLGLNPDEMRFSVGEEDAIDLVAMLFEGLFRTHCLQDRARRLYARLVLPYVKIALQDDAMFVQPGHPARRLLDAITEACEGNDAATAQDRELLERAAAVSQRVVAEFNEDIAVFELAHAELEELLQQQRRRVVLQEDRAAKATFGRERLSDARVQADRVVQRRLAAPPLTQAVAEFLITPWRHHLVQTLLREGVGSTRHAEAARLGNALVEADRLAEAGHGRELADCLIGLEPAIVQCLATSGLDDTAARHGMAWLVSALANRDSARQLHVLPERNADEGGDDEARLWLAGGTDTVPHDAGVAALIRRMKPGQWLRMIGPQGEATAVKLAWISPLTSRLLLVSRRGLRVLVASPEELSALVGAGRLVIGAEHTPFAEAMQQLRHRLDHAVGQR